MLRNRNKNIKKVRLMDMGLNGMRNFSKKLICFGLRMNLEGKISKNICKPWTRCTAISSKNTAKPTNNNITSQSTKPPYNPNPLPLHHSPPHQLPSPATSTPSTPCPNPTASRTSISSSWAQPPPLSNISLTSQHSNQNGQKNIR